MAVTVSDLLALPLLREGQIVAGVGGLTRQVCAVSFSDCPIVFSEEEYKLTKAGDLYLCGYYLFSEGKESLYDRIRFYTQTKSSCLIISTSEPRELPADCIALANQKNYPILLISDKIPYTAIIRTISETIFLSETSSALEQRLESLLHNRLTLDEETSLANHFSVNIGSCCMAFFIKPKVENDLIRPQELLDELLSQFPKPNFSICSYKNFLLLVAGIDQPSDVPSIIRKTESELDSLGFVYHLGISNPYQSPTEFASAIRQAYQCCHIGMYQNRKITEFRQESFANMLYELRHNVALVDYCTKILQPLLEYKANHNIDLIETLQAFFSNNGNYRQTAADLYLHENTVRFRVAKAQSLLNMEDSYRFIKEASLAIDAASFLQDTL